MKKFFEKHTVAKAIGILFLIAIILSWTVKAGQFQGTTLADGGMMRIGFNDIATIFYTSIYFILDKIIYFLVLGGFYAVISKTDGYKKLIANIVNKIKGKEAIFVVVSSIVITFLTSMMSQTLAIFIVIPMLMSIMLKAGINKLTVFASTFGAVLVGILGGIYGVDTLITFDSYMSQGLAEKSALELTIAYRIIILAVATILYNFFLYFAAKKSLESKKKNEEISEAFEVEETKSKKVKMFPIYVILGLTFVITILGFIDWNKIFGITAFNEFHTWLTGLKVGKDFTIVSSILGQNALAFGTWDLLTFSVVLIIIASLAALVYSVKFDELISSFGKGMLNTIKPVGAAIGVYLILVAVYLSPTVPTVVEKILKQDTIPKVNIDYKGLNVALFNVDENEDGKADSHLMNQDKDKDGKCDLNCDTDKDGFPDKYVDINGDGVSDENDEAIMQQITGTSTINADTDGDGKADINIVDSFSLPKTIIAAVYTNIFHPDLGYTGYSMSGYLVSAASGHIEAVFLVFFAIYALLQFFIPSSIILMFGLTYANISIPEWMKYIWRFVLGMLCVLLILFIFITLV